MRRLTAVFLIWSFEGLSAQGPCPCPVDNSITFERYAVHEIFKGKPAKPLLGPPCSDCVDPESRSRDDVIRQAAEGPSFAGSFTLVMLHCGTGCLSIEVVDAESGKVFPGTPFVTLIIGPFGRSDTDMGYVRYRRDSRLLKAAGCFDTVVDETKGYCGTVYYEWRGGRFHLIKKMLQKRRE